MNKTLVAFYYYYYFFTGLSLLLLLPAVIYWDATPSELCGPLLFRIFIKAKQEMGEGLGILVKRDSLSVLGFFVKTLFKVLMQCEVCIRRKTVHLRMQAAKSLGQLQ